MLPQRALYVSYYEGGNRPLINYRECRGITAIPYAAAQSDTGPSLPRCCWPGPALPAAMRLPEPRLSAWQRGDAWTDSAPWHAGSSPGG